MHKLQIEDAGVMRLAIQQEINRNDESRYDHRLHGLLLVAAGQSCRQVGLLFGDNPTTVQRWVSRFEGSGLEGLREGERSGRPRQLQPAQWRNGASCRGSCAVRLGLTVWRRICGMDRSSPNTCAAITTRISGFANANGYFGKWAFGCASPARKSPSPIR
jgi:hypothetical protein